MIKFCDSTLTTNISQSEIKTPQSEIFLSPNPTTGKFAISSNQFAIREIEIYNLLGEKVFDSPLTPKGGIAEISIENLPVGIYIVQASGKEKIFRSKIIKQ